MDAFTMEIAGLAVGVQPLFEFTREYCKAYRTERPPEVFVEIQREELPLEQTLLEREAVEQGLKIRKFKDIFLERSILQRRVADRLLERDTLLLHGSTVSVDGKAYLFTAPCGTGKSTHTRLWREMFGPRAVMVNDDKPFLQITREGVIAWGSPWSGKHGLANNIRVPLQGICVLQRGKENRITQAAAADVVDILRDQAHRPEDSELAEKASALVDSLVRSVSLWTMQCNMDLEAAKVSYGAMCRKGEEG